MTSVNTNAAALTALRTLQNTNKQLDTAQGRISTGYKIGEAKDNAAYWSISTTLKSDNKSLSTVKDALGLGAATVDTAYQGLNKAKEVLDEIKSKLTAATQDGVDRDAVQAEITQLKDQLASIAKSSTFSGENWLSIDSSADGFDANKSVVSSFVRDGSGTVSINSIAISTTGLALYDANTTLAGRGILDSKRALAANGTELTIGGNSLGNLNVGGLKESDAKAGVATALGGYAAVPATKAYTFDSATDKITFSFALNGGSAVTGVTIDLATVQTALGTSASSVAVSSGADMAKVVQQALTNKGITGVTVGVDTASGKLSFTTTATGATADVALTSAVLTSDTTTGIYTGSTGGSTEASAFATGGAAGTKGSFETAAATHVKAAAVMDGFSGPMTLDSDDKITFTLQIDSDTGNTRKVTINRATVNAALGTTDGVMKGSDDFATVITQALKAVVIPTGANTSFGASSGTDLSAVLKAVSSNGSVILRSESTAAGSQVKVIDVKADAGVDSNGSSTSRISVADIDISSSALTGRGVTTPDIKKVITAYINVVSQALEQVTSAAANLGAVGKRIDLQQTFVDTLMDTIEKGVSGLIDADMSEESTKLQALQVKQSLGVQALSIANQASQSILQLFRS